MLGDEEITAATTTKKKQKEKQRAKEWTTKSKHTEAKQKQAPFYIFLLFFFAQDNLWTRVNKLFLRAITQRDTVCQLLDTDRNSLLFELRKHVSPPEKKCFFW